MENTLTTSIEDVRLYAKALRLSHLRNGCAEIIHKAQIEKPSYMDFIMAILKDEVSVRQQNDLQRRMKRQSSQGTAIWTTLTSTTAQASPSPSFISSENWYGLTRCTISSSWGHQAQERPTWQQVLSEMPS